MKHITGTGKRRITLGALKANNSRKVLTFREIVEMLACHWEMRTYGEGFGNCGPIPRLNGICCYPHTIKNYYAFADKARATCWQRGLNSFTGGRIIPLEQGVAAIYSDC